MTFRDLNIRKRAALKTERNRRKNWATIDQQVGIYNRIISRDEDRATYEETLQNAEAEILPFLLRHLNITGKLARVYNAKDVSDAGMKLQSGNLLTELMSLMEPRREETLRSRVNQMVDQIM